MILLTQIITEKYKKQNHWLDCLQKISLFLDDLFLPAKKKDVQPALKFDEIIISSYRNHITERLKATLDYKGQLFCRTDEKIRQRKVRYLHQFEVLLTRTRMFRLSI